MGSDIYVVWLGEVKILYTDIPCVVSSLDSSTTIRILPSFCLHIFELTLNNVL